MREDSNIREVEQLGPDLMGFIFYPGSPRCVTVTPAYLPEKAMRVGVFVNEEKNKVEALAKSFSFTYIQLHGNESPEYCSQLQSKGRKVIKAFSVSKEDDLIPTLAYEGKCDYFLFDTPCKQYGGSGKAFNWNILKAYKGKTPFLLSGGICPEMADALKEFRHPLFAGIDLNSRFEFAPGEKDANKIKEFMNQLI